MTNYPGWNFLPIQFKKQSLTCSYKKKDFCFMVFPHFASSQRWRFTDFVKNFTSSSSSSSIPPRSSMSSQHPQVS